MKSTTGEHYIALDHVRAIAAFMVFAWHFMHGTRGYPIPFEGAPWVLPFTLLDEGHTGVGVFMTLSGYLFAKLLDGRRVDYGPFLWNRILRLAPLLTVVIIAVGIENAYQGLPVLPYAKSVLAGVVKPTLPSGGWSITVEGHFYLVLPALIWLARRWAPWLAVCVLGAVLLRCLIYIRLGEVQWFAYWTIVGRIDQFLLGILMFQYRAHVIGRHLIACSVLILFIAFHSFFNLMGGYFGTSTSALWIVMPTIEGAACAVLIAYYEGTFRFRNTGWSRYLSVVGSYSYSIYLLHGFVVFDLARLINESVMDISNIYVAFVWTVLCFGLMLPVGYLSARYIERPFLRLRRLYIKPVPAPT